MILLRYYSPFQKKKVMKFIVYLYYLIYRFVEVYGYYIYYHSPFTPRDNRKRKGEYMVNNLVTFYSQWLWSAGVTFYLISLLLFLYICGITQVKIVLNKDYKFLWIALLLALLGLIDYFLLERNNRFEKYSEEFSHFSVEKKLLYGSVALVLFLFPIFAIIYEVSLL